MEIKVIYRNGRVTCHSTTDLTTKEPFGCRTLATSAVVHTEDLSRGLWVEMVYHDMDQALIDDTVFSIDPWKIANPTAGQKLWLVPADEMSEVVSIAIDDVVAAEDIGAGHLVNMEKYGRLFRFYFGERDLPEYKKGVFLFNNLVKVLNLDPLDPDTIRTIAERMGWQPEDLALVLETERAFNNGNGHQDGEGEQTEDYEAEEQD